ncbi:hypothetical protein [Streptomyces sp. NPDC001792]|uniref:hypothetical protein n=1 Tax=unclassified Streptomyces TaxID=2593676 RepID=UPI0033223883
MSHRPYPNVDRALSQVDRGRRPAPPSELQIRLAEQANAALEHAGRIMDPVAQTLRPHFPVDEYRLSTR